jgi:O-antigen/teichoic acid export membrane protein
MIAQVESVTRALKGVMGGSSKYIVNTIWLSVERVLRMVVALVVGVWVARYLGPQKFGILNYAQSLVVLVTAISTLGLDSIVTRSLVREPEKSSTILGTSFALRLIGAVAAIIMLTILVWSLALETNTRTIVFIISLSIALQSLNVIDLYYQSISKSKFVVYGNFMASFVSSVVKVILILNNASLEAFAVTAILDQLLIVLGLVYFFQRHERSLFKWKVDTKLMRAMLSQSWPLMFSGISIMIGMRIDQVMIGEMMDESEVGIYAVGVKLAEVFNFIPMVIAQSFFPKVIEMDFDSQRRKFIMLIRAIFWGLVALAVSVNLVSHFAVDTLYGVAYHRSTTVVNVLIWAIPCTFLNIITTSLLLKVSQTRLIMLKQFTVTCINIALNIILIPRYGIVGAACATLVAESSLLLFELFARKYLWILKLRLQAMFFIGN